VPPTSTTISAYMPTLRSSALLGGPENLWLLRRGILADGTPIAAPNYDPLDRIRMVQTFDASAGRVVVDRNWRNPMLPNELADFTHLHPQQELLPAILAGLRRCFLEDRGQVDRTYITSTGDIDLTAQLPWITDPDQVLRIQAGWAWPARHCNVPFAAVKQAGHVLLTGMGYALPGALWMSVLRPGWTWVNSAESTTGPVLDTDTLDLDLDYAASAGHIEAWHLYPSHLYAAAAGNLQATQEMAAREFTRQSLIWGPAPYRDIGFSETVALPMVGLH